MTNFESWIDKAKYDLDAARDMLKASKYDYVAFFCHQSIEKALKGYFLFTNEKLAPYIHNLIKLSEICGVWNDMSEVEKDFIEELNPYYVEIRYPAADIQVYETVKKDKVSSFIKNSEQVIKWLEVKMKY